VVYPISGRRMTEDNNSKTEKFVFRMPGVPVWRVPFIIAKPRNPLSSALFLIYGFLAFSILGALLLVLPLSSQSGQWTCPLTAWFTSVSAICVTGLVVVDTGTYWSMFGQAVLFGLFQVGGLGFIASSTVLLLAIGGRFGLREKLFVSESVGIDRLGGILGVVLKIVLFTVIIEGIGAVVLYIYWTVEGTPGVTIWTAIFHAASAFNNCGMELFGNYQSLIGFHSDPVILSVMAILILFGATSYVVVADLLKKRRLSRLSLDSKIVLITTLGLIVAGTLFYLVMEYDGIKTLGPLAFSGKVLTAFFQAAGARTAGFTAIDINELKPISLYFTMFLMCIGGAAGSVAGGVKVNTLGIVLMTVIGVLRGKQNIGAYDRQISKPTVFRAITLFSFYMAAIGLIIIVLSFTESFQFNSLLFETFSALGTVGLSTGITPDLSIAGKIIIIIAMFLGRLGPLTLMAYMVRHTHSDDIDYPHDTIRLG
jgi:trk system potassium uptake protein